MTPCVCGSCRRRRQTGACLVPSQPRGRHRLAGVVVGLALAGLAVTPLPAAANDGVLARIATWSTADGVDPAAMTTVARCASGLNPAASHARSGATGLSQVLPPPVADLEARLTADPALAPTLTTVDPASRGVDDPDAQAHVTAWAWDRGDPSLSLWSCQP